ncbi:hypothetical protein ZIOFF_018088 [Zingiber officinale]|uniref:Exocyst subunit Exo70 family protein n=1 Tax=Zingiber officinale TaxID=94328 RepID=A0A8J5LAP6_ZINOF|nr:hypothetical protein ZIOFF_018088 [Zingiber officinale]
MLDFVAATAEPSRLSHPCLVRPQTLMQVVMRRLEKEFYQMLAANSDLLDPESQFVRSSRSSFSDDQVSDLWDESASPDQTDALVARESIIKIERTTAVVMTDLRAIADTMVFAGYGFECVRIYRTLRKSVVDEELYRHGFDRSLSSPQIKKMDWAVLELKIRSWLGACRVAVRTLFHRERVLIDHVFSNSNIAREVVFSSVAGNAALQFFAFPEWATKSKWSPEKFFRLLDMHDAIGEVWPEVELVFSFESTSSVRTQALASFAKLTDAARCTEAALESFRCIPSPVLTPPLLPAYTCCPSLTLASQPLSLPLSPFPAVVATMSYRVSNSRYRRTIVGTMLTWQPSLPSAAPGVGTHSLQTSLCLALDSRVLLTVVARSALTAHHSLAALPSTHHIRFTRCSDSHSAFTFRSPLLLGRHSSHSLHCWRLESHSLLDSRALRLLSSRALFPFAFDLIGSMLTSITRSAFALLMSFATIRHRPQVGLAPPSTRLEGETYDVDMV